MKKILIVFGTRPEAIKMAPLIMRLKDNKHLFTTKICITAQHREMLDQVLHLFEIIPDYDLDIMKPGQDLFDITTRVLLSMRDVMSKEKPDLVLVHGDTTSSVTASLASFYHQIPVGHIEAGLRTHNIYSPWPEEMNRQLTGRLATYHFAPTELNKQNLINEGVNPKRIFVTGNTVIDALKLIVRKIKSSPSLRGSIKDELTKVGIPREKVDSWETQSMINGNLIKSKNSNLNARKMVLITGHRRENFGQGFRNIMNALSILMRSYPDTDFVYPVHLNPRVRNSVLEAFGNSSFALSTRSDRECKDNSNGFFIEPLDYLPFVYLMSISYFLLTDSGGIQEEAPSLGKPVLVMRDTTERPEALASGTIILVGTDTKRIVYEASRLLEDSGFYQSVKRVKNPYGEGNASLVIEKILRDLQNLQ